MSRSKKAIPLASMAVAGFMAGDIDFVPKEPVDYFSVPEVSQVIGRVEATNKELEDANADLTSENKRLANVEPLRFEDKQHRADKYLTQLFAVDSATTNDEIGKMCLSYKVDAEVKTSALSVCRADNKKAGEVLRVMQKALNDKSPVQLYKERTGQ